MKHRFIAAIIVVVIILVLFLVLFPTVFLDIPWLSQDTKDSIADLESDSVTSVEIQWQENKLYS